MADGQAATFIGALASTVAAHGHLDAIAVDGTPYTAYDPSFYGLAPNCLDNGFVEPSMYGDATKIACHKDATPGAKVASSHKGLIIDYLAKVADATTAKLSDLQFFKIDEAGIEAGHDIADGQYVLRHELIALHSAGQASGAQNYPKCINIEVAGGGSATPTGTAADALYKADDAGLMVNIFGDVSSYKIPGPAVYSAAAKMFAERFADLVGLVRKSLVSEGRKHLREF
ncbi:hypothetical protein BU23DRAFT_586520 [Bimuria novae-zelandiae CBS 107.79]|uniref:AA9 family lytic polysaccharide monooxygenase n=1 Tax=Bimuria novae-zelandiae CBS 107.79 TaxID=1447943 RepID=A0A6A5VRL1_9PLEO|nr:hypothetical protein BU23DRAFT_586520 [Bimuria novae-zelandiae CBS 107.79]